MKTPEGKLKDEVKKYLKSIGAYYFMPVQMGFGATTLDFLICYRGRFFGIETKNPEFYPPTPTARQKKIIDEINKSGGFAFCANELNEIKAKLDIYAN